MKNNKIKFEFPIKQLWNDNELIHADRERYLTKRLIQDILKSYPVEFVIADISYGFKWIDVYKCYDFWKSEVKQHIADDIDNIYLDQFPNNYAYIASEWSGEIETPIVLLEKYH